MGKSYIEGLPLGECRRQAMLDNANHIESESMDLGRVVSETPHPDASVGTMNFDHLFFQRVKLLAVMVKAIANGFPMGEHRKTALKDNLDIVCKALTFSGRADMTFLKVA